MKTTAAISAALLAGALSVATTAASAAVIIDNSTSGYYNAGLGDLSTVISQTDSGTGASLFPAANSAGGDPVIPPISTEPDTSGVAALGTWLTAAAPSGGSWSANTVAIPSNWAVNSETAIVYEIDAGAGISNFNIDLGVDNGIYVWLNGDYLFGAMAPGGAALSEYDINIGSISGGTHYLQVLREDHGGATGYLISATGDFAVRVPEPQVLALVGIGLVGLAFGARRKAGAA